MKKLACLALVPFSVAAYSNEQTNILITSYRGDEPVEEKVSAVTVITQTEILRSGASNLVDVLRNKAGIYITDTNGDGNGTIDMRGFGESAASNTLIMVDGRRLNNPDISSPNLNSIVLSNIERIEIIKGSAGVLYGDQAVGGVINIITRDVSDFSSSVTAQVGSYNKKGVSASMSNRFAEHFTYQLVGETVESDNYRDHNESETNYFFSRLGYDTDTTELFVEYQYDDEYRQLPGALTAAEAEEDRQQSKDDFANDFNDVREISRRVGARQSLSENWKLLAEYSQRREDTDYTLNFSGCSPFCSTAIDEERRDINSFTPRVVGLIPVLGVEAEVTAGGDFERTEYEIESTWVNRSNDQKVDSYYINVNLPLGAGWTVNTGGRYSRVENSIVDATTYPNGGEIDDTGKGKSLGVAKAFSNVRIFARYDENFRFAKVDELAFTDPNVDLRTQHGKSKEVGIETQTVIGDLRVLAYRLDIEDEIAYDPTADGPYGVGTGANVNFDSTRRDGFSIEIDKALTQQLNVMASYSSVDSEFTSGIYDGNEVSGVPETLASVALGYEVFSGLNLQVETKYVGEQYLSGDNDNTSDKKKGYSVSHFAAHYEVGNWSLNFRVNNLFDKEYSEYENAYGAVNPSPERNLNLAVTYQF